MSRKKKRTRVVAERYSSNGITIVPKVDAQGYTYYLVQGWKIYGKWQRRRFKNRAKAETFAASLRIDMENTGRSQRMVLSALTEDQHTEALRAFDRLGDTYTLDEAVDYFLRHHRPPDFTIRLDEAVELYIREREQDGLRPTTVKGIEWTLNPFIRGTDNPLVHEIAAEAVQEFLKGLRARNGRDKAPRRSWELHRGILHRFFSWCATPDTATNRPFTFTNPVDGIRKFTAKQVREQQEATPSTTSPETVRRMFSVLMRWRGGIMVRPFAMLYFGGLRPEELKRLAEREDELLNLKTRTIKIPASVSKTRHERDVDVPANLAAWLEDFPGELIPANYATLSQRVRKHFSLSHDEARHSFISYHVALHRSLGDAALQAGNSESIVRRHYLNVHTREEGSEFFRIIPGERQAVLADPVEEQPAHLKAV